MAEVDQAVKALFQGHINDIAHEAVPELRDLTPVSAEPVLPTQRIADAVYQAQLFAVPCIVNIEIQLHGDKDMGWRMDLYAARLMSIFERPVLSIVLWLEPSAAIPPALHQNMAGPYTFNIRPIIYLEVYTMDAPQVVKTGSLGLLPLTPFMQGATEEVLIAAGLRIEAEAAHQDKRDLESILALFVSRKHGSDFSTILLRRITNMNTSFSQNFPLYHQFHDEGIAEGKAQGQAVGIAIGKAEGEAVGLRESFTLIWQARFGALPEDMAPHLETATVDELKALVAQAVTATQDQIRTQLGM